MSSKAKQHADPFKTRTGKPRLGTLNFKQLNDLIAKESRPKNKAKIQRRIHELVQRGGDDFSAVSKTADMPENACTSEINSDQV